MKFSTIVALAILCSSKCLLAAVISDSVACCMRRFGDVGYPFTIEERYVGRCDEVTFVNEESQIELWSLLCHSSRQPVLFYTPSCPHTIRVDCDQQRLDIEVKCSETKGSERCRNIDQIDGLTRTYLRGTGDSAWSIRYACASHSPRMSATSILPQARDNAHVLHALPRDIIVFVDSVRSKLPRYEITAPALWPLERRVSFYVDSMLRSTSFLQRGKILDSLCSVWRLSPSQTNLVMLLSRPAIYLKIFGNVRTDAELDSITASIGTTSGFSHHVRQVVTQAKRDPFLDHDGSYVLQWLNKTTREMGYDSDTIHLYFWAPWCMNCRDVHTEIVQYADSVSRAGHTFLSFAVQCSRDQFESVYDKFPGINLHLHHINDAKIDGSLQRAFGVTGVPRLLRISRDGTSYKRHVTY